jgi:hypothetical protein
VLADPATRDAALAELEEALAAVEGELERNLSKRRALGMQAGGWNASRPQCLLAVMCSCAHACLQQ